MDREYGSAEGLVQVSIDFRTHIISRHVAQQSRQLAERLLVYTTAILLDAVSGTCPQLLNGPAFSGHTDDRHLQAAAFHHGLQGRKDLLVGQVASGSKEHQHIRLFLLHSLSPHVYRYFPTPV